MCYVYIYIYECMTAVPKYYDYLNYLFIIHNTFVTVLCKCLLNCKTVSCTAITNA